MKIQIRIQRTWFPFLVINDRHHAAKQSNHPFFSRSKLWRHHRAVPCLTIYGNSARIFLSNLFLSETYGLLATAFKKNLITPLHTGRYIDFQYTFLNKETVNIFATITGSVNCLTFKINPLLSHPRHSCCLFTHFPSRKCHCVSSFIKKRNLPLPEHLSHMCCCCWTMPGPKFLLSLCIKINNFQIGSTYSSDKTKLIKYLISYLIIKPICINNPRIMVAL
jgi:hypothetical protein